MGMGISLLRPAKGPTPQQRQNFTASANHVRFQGQNPKTSDVFTPSASVNPSLTPDAAPPLPAENLQADTMERNAFIDFYDGQVASGKSLLTQAFSLKRKNLDAQPQPLITGLQEQAMLYQSLGMADQAAPLLEEALTLTRQKFPDAPEREISLSQELGQAYMDSGQTERAEQIWLSTLKVLQSTHGETSLPTARIKSDLTRLYFVQHRYDEAALMGRAAVKTLKTLRASAPASENLTEMLQGTLWTLKTVYQETQQDALAQEAENALAQLN